MTKSSNFFKSYDKLKIKKLFFSKIHNLWVGKKHLKKLSKIFFKG